MSISISKNFYDVSIIPKNWTEKRLKNILSISENKSSNFNNEKILSLTKKGIVINDISSNKGQIAQSYEKYIKVKKGQICMNPMDLLSGWVDISYFEGLISPAYYTFELNEKVENKFLNYFLQSNYLRKTFFKLGKGVASHDNFGRWVLTPEELKNIYVFIPNIEEQKLISHYLDKKVGQIDKLIDKIQKKIELLKEQRISLINQCVTKGLNPNIEMKDSGIEWIGKIPKHWSLRKLKHFYTYQKGSMGQKLTSSYLDENSGEYPVYSGQTSKNGILGTWSDYEFDFDTEVIFCTTVGAKLMTTKVLSGKFSLSQNCLIMIPKDSSILSKYINYFLLYDFRIRRELLPSILQPSLRMEDLDQYWILVPPVEEQIKIVDLVNQHMTPSVDMISKLISKISLLNEYRQSLISSVVTGKVRISEDMI